tara:strand:+ start:62 stop:577 length:516 start_codon:yes stop_codon:yes gene_type:complete
MATLHHNISGELSTEILAPGDRMNVTSISFANVNTFKHVLLDFFMQKAETGKFYLLKNVKIPAGASYIYDTNINNRTDEFGLYVKLKAADTFVLTGSINPTDSSTVVTGTSTLFTKELTVGDSLIVSGETKTITSITNNTTLAIDTTFSSALATDSDPECTPTALVDVIIS